MEKNPQEKRGLFSRYSVFPPVQFLPHWVRVDQRLSAQPVQTTGRAFVIE